MEVIGLWRYPVKSLQGEPIDAASVEADGVADDRRWGLRDQSTGRILTARRHPELLGASATYDDELAITLPDGSTVVGPGRRTDRQLSEWLAAHGSLVSLLGGERGRPDYLSDATDDTSQAHRVDDARGSVRRRGPDPDADRCFVAHRRRAPPRRHVGRTPFPAQRPDRRRRRRVGRGLMGRAPDPGRSRHTDSHQALYPLHDGHAVSTRARWRHRDVPHPCAPQRRPLRCVVRCGHPGELSVGDRAGHLTSMP